MLTVISPLFKIISTEVYDNHTLYSFFTYSDFSLAKFSIKREAFASILIDNAVHASEKQNLDSLIEMNNKIHQDITDAIKDGLPCPIHIDTVNTTYCFKDINLKLAGMESPEYEKTTIFLRTSDGKHALKKIGRILYIPSRIRNTQIIIGGFPICGVILPIKRSSQYMLYNGELKILDNSSQIPYALPNLAFAKHKAKYAREEMNPYGNDNTLISVFAFASKVVYLTAELYDALSFNEYVSFFDQDMDSVGYDESAYSIKRDIYPIGMNDDFPVEMRAYYLGKTEEVKKNPMIDRLFKPKRNVNLFGLDGLPKGIRKKNNEFITTLK